MAGDRDEDDERDYSVRDAIDACASRRQAREILEGIESLTRAFAELARQNKARADEKPPAPEPSKPEELPAWAVGLLARVNQLADSIAGDPELVAGVRSKVLERFGVKPAANGRKPAFLPHDPDE